MAGSFHQVWLFFKTLRKKEEKNLHPPTVFVRSIVNLGVVRFTPFSHSTRKPDGRVGLTESPLLSLLSLVTVGNEFQALSALARFVLRR
jgi:hypothetical protein